MALDDYLIHATREIICGERNSIYVKKIKVNKWIMKKTKVATVISWKIWYIRVA